MPSLFGIAWKNLRRKRLRSLLTIVGIALSTWVLVSLLGFNHGYETALNKDIDNMGFQMMKRWVKGIYGDVNSVVGMRSGVDFVASE